MTFNVTVSRRIKLLSDDDHHPNLHFVFPSLSSRHIVVFCLASLVGDASSVHGPG